MSAANLIDTEAEQWFIGTGCSVNETDRSEMLATAEGLGLAPDDFTASMAHTTWTAMVNRSRQGLPINLVELADDLEKYGHDRDAAEGFLTACAQKASTVTFTAHYAARLKEASQIRRLYDDARMVVETINRGNSVAKVAAQLKATCEAVEGGGTLLPATDAADYLETEPPTHDPVLENVFDMGDKAELIGGSKRRKSFAAIEMAVHVATGRDWLGLHIPKRRRVQYVNLELKTAWIHRRIRRACRAHGIDPAELRGWLCVVNARGKGATVRKQLVELARRDRAGLVIVDPRYKLHLPGEVENAGEGVAGILDLLDRVAESGPAVLVVHHDPKGDSGDRAIQDRGGGSNWAGRDVDARLTLTPQKHDPEGASVVAVMCRNFAPIPDFCIRWEDDRFHLAPDAIPLPFTSLDRKRAAQGDTMRSPEYFEPAALDAAREAIGRNELLCKIQVAGASRDMARACLDGLVARGEVICTPRVGQKNGVVKYGLPAVIQSYMNPRLPV